MKNVIIASLAYVAISSVVLMSCGKAINCVNLVSAVSTASSNYANNPSVANCNEYKTAMQNWINTSSCSGADATTKANFQAEIDSLVCQ